MLPLRAAKACAAGFFGERAAGRLDSWFERRGAILAAAVFVGQLIVMVSGDHPVAVLAYTLLSLNVVANLVLCFRASALKRLLKHPTTYYYALSIAAHSVSWLCIWGPRKWRVAGEPQRNDPGKVIVWMMYSIGDFFLQVTILPLVDACPLRLISHRVRVACLALVIVLNFFWYPRGLPHFGLCCLLLQGLIVLTGTFGTHCT